MLSLYTILLLSQYIPLSIYDLQTWMGHPSVYVWDCNSAGTVVSSFIRFTKDHEREWTAQFDDHCERTRSSIPIVRTDMTIEQKADAFAFRRPPNYRVCSLVLCITLSNIGMYSFGRMS